MERLLTIKDIETRFSISRATVDRWRREGMPYQKVGRQVRFEEQEVLKWIKEHKQQ